jgi:radical SAM protein with 4Fe4S-binding SPASM domain
MKVDRWNLDSNKLAWHMDRVHKHFVLGKRIAPILIDAGITKLCNIKCEFCYGIFQKMTGEMVPGEALIRLFHDAPKAGVKAIAIVGDGEPTLHPQLYEAIIAGAEGGLDMAMATNGVKISDDQMILLLNNLVWLRFNVSAIEEGYVVVHGRSYWDIVKHNIERAVQIKKALNLPVTIGIQMVLTPHAAEYVLREAQFAIDAGVDYFVIKQFSDPKCDKMVGPEAEWQNSEETQKVLKQAEGMSTFATRIIPKYQAIEWAKKRPYDRCLDVPLLFQMSGDGKCYPCGYLFGDEKYCYGDIAKQSLGEILASEKYWKIIKYMQEEFDVHKDCSGCCRHDSSNKFIHDFVNKPEHINFI